MQRDDGAALLAAHAARDARVLVGIYRDGADTSEAAGRIDEACFLLTQAYIWALEAGFPEASNLHARLRAYGREE